VSENNTSKDNPLFKHTFSHITARDVIKRLSKYYPYAKKYDRRSSPRLLASYVYIAYNLLGETFEDNTFEKRFTQRNIMAHLNITATSHFYRYTNHHTDYMKKSNVYREKLLLCITDLKFIEDKKIKKIHEKINV